MGSSAGCECGRGGVVHDTAARPGVQEDSRRGPGGAAVNRRTSGSSLPGRYRPLTLATLPARDTGPTGGLTSPGSPRHTAPTPPLARRSSLMARRITRRQALAAGAASLGYFFTGPSFSVVRAQGANGKLYVAGIGVGGKGSSDIDDAAECAKEVGGEVIVICDIDEGRLNSTAGQDGLHPGRQKKFAGTKFFEKAQKFTDFRKIFDDSGLLKNIDAFTVSTPDHTH